jgi:hypothetical protein
MYRPNSTVPDRAPLDSRFISELCYPSALIRSSTYDCVQDELLKAASRSPLLFNNTTKQDRYSVKKQ